MPAMKRRKEPGMEDHSRSFGRILGHRKVGEEEEGGGRKRRIPLKPLLFLFFLLLFCH